MYAEIMQNDVFPARESVTCRFTYPEQPGGGMFLRETRNLLVVLQSGLDFAAGTLN